MRFLLVMCLALLGSCGIYSNLDSAAKNLVELSSTAKARVDQVDAMLDTLEAKGAQLGVDLKNVVSEGKAVVASSDKNGDGTISGFNEWILVLAGMVGLLLKQTGSDSRRRETIKEIFGQLDSVKSRLPPASP